MTVTTVNIAFSPDDLTIGDLEDFEEVCGLPIHKAMAAVLVKDEDDNKVLDEQGRPATEVRLSAKALKALVWITQRHLDPAFTLADARNVKVGTIDLTDRTDQGNDSSATPA